MSTVQVTVDTSTFDRRFARLRDKLRTKKMSHLWPDIANTISERMKDKYRGNWSDEPSLSETYKEWKQRHGFPRDKLKMQGRLEEHLTGGEESLLDQQLTREDELVLSTQGVTNDEGFPYPAAVHEGFTVTTPYGNPEFDGTIDVPPREFMWRDEWVDDVEASGARFAGRMAEKVWGEQATSVPTTTDEIAGVL